MLRTLRAVRFLFIGPVILAGLFLVNLFATPGEWWFQWAAIGIGIAWFVCLIRVVTALVVVGGVAGLIVALRRRGILRHDGARTAGRR